MMVESKAARVSILCFKARSVSTRAVATFGESKERLGISIQRPFVIETNYEMGELVD
jgi:hypothetical protein